jgi:hypothetical protein
MVRFDESIRYQQLCSMELQLYLAITGSKLESLWSSPAYVDISLGAIMRLEADMTRRKRRQFTPEFKADAVKLVRDGGRSIAQTEVLPIVKTASVVRKIILR